MGEAALYGDSCLLCGEDTMDTSQFISLIVKRVDFIELGTNCLRLWFQQKSHKALGT